MRAKVFGTPMNADITPMNADKAGQWRDVWLHGRTTNFQRAS